MNMSKLKSLNLKVQQGATLIVSLVILAVITLLGVASMRSSNLELKMAASARDRSVAFQAAESALGSIERSLVALNYPVSAFDSNCTGNLCFKADCSNGQCFIGEFDSTQSRKNCRLADPDNLQREAWKTGTHWTTNGKHKVLQGVPKTDEKSPDVTVKYMLEFLCFTPIDNSEVMGASGAEVKQQEADVPLYRITVLASGESNRSSVMLQSVYKAAN
jgi:type IV pilus assembly protein PilX